MVKKIAILCLVGISCFSIVALAQSGMFNTTTPTQQYQSTDGTTPAQTPQSPQTTAPSQPLSPSQQLTLQQQLSRLNQLNLLYQQKTDQKIEALGTRSQQMETELQSMSGQLAGLKQSIQAIAARDQATPSATQASTAQASGWMQPLLALDQALTPMMKMMLIAGLFLLGLILGYLVPGRKRVIVQAMPTPSAEPSSETFDHEKAAKAAPVAYSAPEPRTPSPKTKPAKADQKPARPRIKVPVADVPIEDIDGDNDTRNEYDFMGSDEAIPAKIDLARAYVAMEDYPAAREVIQEVLHKGNAAQKNEAKQILANLPAEHKATSK